MIRESNEDFLLLSGIQHMAFCERQWALIHVEQAWAENVRTVEGKHLHERADDPFKDESRSDVRIVRALPVLSKKLGLRGVADVVEFQRVDQAIPGETCTLAKRQGDWKPLPIEYKRGRPKSDDRDAVQLCAQAMALEEMLQVRIEKGYLFYGQTRRREMIVFDDALRERTVFLAERMHVLFAQGLTPKAEKGKHCSLCSLVELCQPKWNLRSRSVSNYLAKMCQVEEDILCEDC